MSVTIQFRSKCYLCSMFCPWCQGEYKLPCHKNLGLWLNNSNDIKLHDECSVIISIIIMIKSEVLWCKPYLFIQL